MFGLFRSPTPSFRALTSRDGGECAALHAPAFAHPWSRSDFEKLLADRSSIADGAFISRAMAGFCLARHAAGEAEILTIVVAEHARRKGIGRGLLAHCIARLAAAGARELFLEVESGNAAAIALYREFGFAQVGERPAYTRLRDGTLAKALIMRRALT